MTFQGHCRKIDVECSAAQRDSFSNLKPDEYHPDGSRYRRFGQYKLVSKSSEWSVETLPTRPFVQPKQNNNLVGGIKRYFASIQVDIDNLILQGAVEGELSHSIEWLVNVNQYRVVASENNAGTPVPEGPHRDGADMILMACPDRQNVTGGISSVFDDNMTPVFKGQLAANQGLLVNDTISYHDASQICLEAGKSAGYRDLFVIGYNNWNRGKYGAEFEIKHTGSEADLSLVPQD